MSNVSEQKFPIPVISWEKWLLMKYSCEVKARITLPIQAIMDCSKILELTAVYMFLRNNFASKHITILTSLFLQPIDFSKRVFSTTKDICWCLYQRVCFRTFIFSLTGPLGNSNSISWDTRFKNTLVIST